MESLEKMFTAEARGVTRTFNEVGFEARMRGELQAGRVWRDDHGWKKKRVEAQE